MIRDIGRFHLLIVVAYQWPGPPTKERVDLASPMEQTAGPQAMSGGVHNVTYENHMVQRAMLHMRYNTTEWQWQSFETGGVTSSRAHTPAETERPLAS